MRCLRPLAASSGAAGPETRSSRPHTRSASRCDLRRLALDGRTDGEALEVLAPGDVGGAADGAPALVADLLHELVQALSPARAQHDRGAPLGEQPRGCLADTAARSGDGDDLAADAGHQVSLSGKVDICPFSSEATGHVSA